MLVTEFRYLDVTAHCWLGSPTPMLKDRGCWRRKRSKLSPTSQSFRQHISYPTSVTNIDVAVEVGYQYLASMLDSLTALRARYFCVKL